MKITGLYIKNFLGVELFESDITKPVCLVAGPNASGKSSIQNAIRMIITGEPSRVSLKKDFGELVKTGSPYSKIEIVENIIEGESPPALMIKKSGLATGLPSPANAPKGLKECMDPTMFPRMTDKERKNFIMEMFGARMDYKEIREMVVKEGVSEEIIDSLKDFLRSGFKEAESQSKLAVSIARSKWKELTGEVYGNVKASEWSPDIPNFDEEKYTCISEQIRKARSSVKSKMERIIVKEAFLKAIGDNKAEMARLTAAYEQPVIPHKKLMELRNRRDKIKTSITLGDSVLQKEEYDLTKIGENASVQLHGDSYHCPSCKVELLLKDYELVLYADNSSEEELAIKEKDERLLQIGAKKLKIDKLREELFEERKEYDTLGKRILTAEGAIQNVDYARIRIEEREKSVRPPDCVDDNIDTLKTNAALATCELDDLKRELSEMNAIKAEVDRLTNIGIKAQEYYKKVIEWESLHGLMSPTGIPSKIIGPCIAKINEKLSDYCISTGWGLIKITSDGLILQRDRNYYLLSESEQWIVGVMIATAISSILRLDFVIVDRMDVLSPTNRSTFIKWCMDISEKTDFQFLIFATLKAKPSMEGVQSIWLGVNQ